MLAETIKLHCPTCGKTLRIPLYRSATYIAVRTCRGCKERWLVKAEVLLVKGGAFFHEITWSRPFKRL